MSRGKYRSGAREQMSPAWKERVREAMRNRKVTHRKLEEMIGAGSGQVSKMLSDAQTTSAWVGPVSEALEITGPGLSPCEEDLIRRYRQADDEGKLKIRAAAEAVAGE